jgi:glycerophosphoryl diester phosphodiesterase
MELEIIAHRGFSAIAPENTLAAFAAAVKHGPIP